MDVPEVKRADYPCLAVTDDGFVSLLLPSGSTKEDLKLPEGELGEQIRALVDDGKEVLVSVVTAMGEEAIISFKEQATK